VCHQSEVDATGTGDVSGQVATSIFLPSDVGIPRRSGGCSAVEINWRLSHYAIGAPSTVMQYPVLPTSCGPPEPPEPAVLPELPLAFDVIVPR
jgi:hypothetical protein